MKKNWRFFVSVVQLTVGILAIASYILLAMNGEAMAKWTVTLLLAAAFVILGLLGLAESRKKREE